MGIEFICLLVVTFILLVILVAVFLRMMRIENDRKKYAEDNKRLNAKVHKADSLLKEQVYLKDNLADNYEELKERYETANRLAYTDSLTELPNRAQFFDIFDGVMEGLEAGEYASLLMIKLANYDKLVSRAGSVIGDDFVYEFSKRLQNNLTPVDFLARTDKDEFAVITRIEYNMAAYDERMNALGNILSQTITISGQEILPKVYMGCTKAPMDGRTVHMLRLNVRLALNKAAADDEPGIHYYREEMAAQTMKRMELGAALAGVTDEEGFSYVLKAQTGLKSGTTSSYDITVRWDTGKYGSLMPEQFLMYAEDTDIAKRIFIGLFRHSCEIVKKFEDAGYRDISFIVPCIVDKFTDEDYTKIIYNILQEVSVNPSKISISVPEKVILANEEASIALMNRINMIGISFVIDNFGDGSASLNILAKAPVSKVRLAHDFLKGQTKTTGEQMLRTVVELLHSFGIMLIVPDVDAKEDEIIPRRVKADFAEGLNYKGYMSEDMALEHARVTQK